MHNVFKSQKLNEDYDKFGFVILRSFYNEQELDEIQELYDELFPDRPSTKPGMWATIYHPNYINQKVLSDKIMSITARKAEEVFNSRILAPNVIMDKFPGENSDCYAHRDWSVMDETKYEGSILWSPLHDITMQSGPVYFLPGSHKILSGIQVPLTTWPYSDFQKIIEKYSRVLLANRGDAIIYSHKIIHGSLPNLTSSNRPVITIGMAEKNAELMYYYQSSPSDPSDSRIEAYKVDDAFFQTHQIGTKPEGIPVYDVISKNYEQYTETEFEALCQSLPHYS